MSARILEARSLTKNDENAPYLGIGLPVRRRSPVDFWMHLYQLLMPLNTKVGYIIQKAAEKNVVDGKLPAAARNEIIEKGLEAGMKYIMFLDDDVLFPDITLYRMWVQMQKHPEIACITAVGCTKLTPVEPLIYKDGQQGAYWDFHLGALTPIHSGWAGCMLVNLDYVKKIEAPWFNDVVVGGQDNSDERFKRNVWGQDRWFHMQLQQAGGLVMADTGLLVAHYDADLQKAYILPPDAPCFKKPFLGESFITFYDNNGYVNWRRIIVPDMPDKPFRSYLDWLAERTSKEDQISMIPAQPKEIKIEEKEGFKVSDNRNRTENFGEWFKTIGVGE